MHRSLISLSFFLGLLFVAGPACSAQPPAPDDPKVGFRVLEDPTAQLSFDQILARDLAGDFAAPEQNGLAAGYTRSAFWLKFSLTPQPGQEEFWLEIDPPYLDYLDLYWPDAKGEFAHYRLGDRLPFSQRPIPYRSFVWPLPLKEHSASSGPITGYLRVQTHSSSLLLLKAWQPSDFYLYAPKSYFLFALLIGIALSLLAFNLRQTLWRQDSLYRAYLVFLGFQALALILFNGFATQFFFQDSPQLASDLVPLVSMGLLLSISYAYLRFLSLSWQKTPVLWSLTWLNLIGGSIGVLGVFLDFYVDWAPIQGLLTVSVYLLWLVRGLDLIRQRQADAPWLVLSSASGLLGSIATILVLLGHVAVDTVGLYAYQIGALGAVIGFQMVISGRVKRQLEQASEHAADAQHAQRELDAERLARQAQEQFLVMLNHELKTPLSVIRLTLADCDALRELQPLGIAAVQDIESVVDRSITTDRMENHRLVAHLEPLSLPHLMDDLIDQQGLSTRCEWIKQKPDLTLLADPVILRVILNNLLENARKYSPKDTPITLRWQATAKGLLFDITNTLGPAGAPSALQAFDKYYRAPKAKQITGSGLGLYLVKGLVMHMGGEVSFRVVHERITFSIFWPHAHTGPEAQPC
jgi:signal transduction histidine kinase